MSGKAAFLIALAGSVALPAVAGAAVIYSGGTYSQTFDSLPNTPENVNLGATPIGWTDDNAAPGAGNFSIVGWYLYHPIVSTEGGFSGNQRMRIGPGGANTGAFWSYGPSGNTDRALSSLASNALEVAGASQYVALRLTNNSTDTYTSFNLSYDGEQWRDGGSAAPNAQQLEFQWSTTATTPQDPAYTDENSLDFVSPVFTNTGAGAAVDGNGAGKVAISGSASGLVWAPGTDLWIRWSDVNNAGNDHGLGIDNLSFEALVPEPTGLAVLALGGLGLLTRRRSR